MILSAEEFLRLSKSNLPEEYRRSALEDASLEVWLEVLQQDPDMAHWVANNRTIPPGVISLLAKHPDARVRSRIADKRKVSEEVLSQLAQDQDDSVRLRVAFNPKVPQSILKELSQDPWIRIREVVSQQLKSSSDHTKGDMNQGEKK